MPNVKGIKATASWDENKELVRLDVTDFFKGQKPTPGMFYFLYEPGRLRGYESHPFTLCTWNSPNVGSIATSETSSLDEKRKESDDADLKDLELGIKKVNAADTILNIGASLETRHTFLIRPRDGFTQRLRNWHSRDFNILLEGPYGTGVNMRQYASVTMIVGGSGITAAISRAYSLLRYETPGNVRLIWAARRRQTVDDVCAHELSGVLVNSRFSLDVFMTSAMEAKSESLSNLHYTLHSGRPDIDCILDEEREKCAGSMAVFCCGPSGLDASVRRSVRRLLDEEGPHVAFFEERFSW